MAARPSKQTATATAPRPTSAPAAPRVRDFATSAAGFRIEWDIRSIYDFLFSLSDEDDFPHDLLEIDRTWIGEARATLAAAHPDDALVVGSDIAILVGSFAVEHPELRTVDTFLDALEATPTQSLLSTMLCDLMTDPDLGSLVIPASTGDRDALRALREAIPEHKVGLQVLLEDPADGLARLIAILRTWAGSFAEVEPRILAYLERDHALRAVDRGLMSGTDLIERTTGGIRWLPEPSIKRVILAPTYFSRPYNILLAGLDWRFFAYPVADEALEAADRLAPPQSVVRLHRALGDDTRLRILKLLAGRDLYLTEIAQQLDLSKPTIKHHLAQLRAAGLVTVVEAGSVIYYSLRRDRIESASADLASFLTP